MGEIDFRCRAQWSVIDHGDLVLRPALAELAAVCDGDDVPFVPVPVDYASHSTHVEGLRESLRESLSGLDRQRGDVEFISTVTGAGVDTSILDGEYWFANLRQPVLFEHAVRWAHGRGCRTFIESSQHPTLTGGIQDSLDVLGDGHGVVGTLRCDEGARHRSAVGLRGLRTWEDARLGRPARRQRRA